MQWETNIGLEVHLRLATKSKLFSSSANSFGCPPNTQASVIDLGFPGILPVLNEAAVKMAVKFGLSIHGTIANQSYFSRKHYFYPDLPKGYQITQCEDPLIKNGYLDIFLENQTIKRISIVQAHLEEDAGKSFHQALLGMTGIDFNRAGLPLIEIVSKPELASAKEAVCYLKTLRSLVQGLAISDANMQEGSFRCDANISIRPKRDNTLGTPVEIKNLNSFCFLEKALNYEIKRQISVVENGEAVVYETRHYRPEKNETAFLRKKEKSRDYRYFHDPDLPPLVIEPQTIAEIAQTLPRSSITEIKHAR